MDAPEAVDSGTQAGGVDTLRGGTAIAIFDVGPHQPFGVSRGDGEANNRSRYA